MNKDRRKRLNSLSTKLSELKTILETFQIAQSMSMLEDIKSEVESIKDDEQEAKDNMPQSLQEGERGQSCDAAIEAMEDAESSLGEISDLLEGMEDFAHKIDNAITSLDEAEHA